MIRRIRSVLGLPALGLAACLLAGTASPALAGYADLVIDAESGQVLHAESADTRNYPASLTKMMTLYMTFDALKSGKLTLDRRLPVSKRAEGMAPSKLGLRAGQSIRVEDAILALVTKSANDVAVVLAEGIGGSEPKFAQMMTAKARQLGMTRTTFRNASGLPNSGQLTTARDMARLGQALIYDHPQHYRYFSTRSFTYNGDVHNNHNRLMSRYDGMDGLKTGFINASGFNLVGSAKRDGRRLVAVVMGGQSAVWRDNRMAQLLDDAFENRGVYMADAAPVKAPLRLARAAASNGGPVFAPIPGRKPGSPANGPAPDLPTLSLASTAIAAPVGAPNLAGPPSGWGIQVGAFGDSASSQRAVAKAVEREPSLLNAGTPNVIEVATAKGAIFRARIMGLNEKTARAACARLARSGAGCLTVPPADAE